MSTRKLSFTKSSSTPRGTGTPRGGSKASLPSPLAPPTIKLAVVGPKEAGKTTITIQFVQEIFTKDYYPTVEDEHTKHYLHSNGQKMNVEVHDTRGQERFVSKSTFNSLTLQTDLPEWLVKKEIQGVVLVYSVGSERSLAELAKLLPNLPKVPAVIIGNKLDMEREVTTESATEIAKEYGYELFELSAKSKDKVDEAFDFLLGKIVAISLASLVAPVVVAAKASKDMVAKASKDNLTEEGKLEKSGSCILS